MLEQRRHITLSNPVQFLLHERTQVADRAAQAPAEPDAFVHWFDRLREDGPGQNDLLFPWLAGHATLDDMRWFLRQEVACGAEQSTSDLADGSRIACWDREIGLGGIQVVWEALARINLMTALAMRPDFAQQSLGAIAVSHLTAPERAAHVHAGLCRLGIGGEIRSHYAREASCDRAQAARWSRELLAPLVAECPEAAARIAEGALLCLRAGVRCYERYRRELWWQPQPALSA